VIKTTEPKRATASTVRFNRMVINGRVFKRIYPYQYEWRVTRSMPETSPSHQVSQTIGTCAGKNYSCQKTEVTPILQLIRHMINATSKTGYVIDFLKINIYFSSGISFFSK